ncbi:oligosaccharide flippase family protein [Polaribacter litorisediminis]|uniref:oligosaccharide flippase family protein n=1 Tax=Polaribacter litorisediminis TaxID=1908341 RepID=UPI001CBDDBC9|nr:oligosaccharide flippase family protein [Polaribacter litorisediminis]UAM97196.1 oligosaccharide flippase family protein [Polaribacter litorisediminis]
MSKNKLIKNTTIYALGDIIPRLIGFIALPILTQYLTPADYGIVNYVNTLNTFLLALGFLSINTYFLVFYYRCKSSEEQKKLLGNLSSFVILLNAILVALLLFFGEPLLHALGSNIDFYPYIVVAIFINFFNLFSILPSALFRVIEKPLPLTILNILRGVITFILTLVLVIYFNYTALGVLYANLIVNFIFAFIFLMMVRNHIIWNLNLTQIKKVLAFSLPLVPGSIAYYLTTISDRILIDRYLSLSDLGIYSIAATIAFILNIFSYGAYKAFEPYIFKNWGSKQFLAIFENIRNSFVYVLLIGVLCLSVFSKEFFILMTDIKFHEAYWYVPLIIIGVYSASLSMLYGTIITAKEKTKINSLISMIGATISVTLNMIFLPKYGLFTAAIVSSFAMTVMLSISIWYAKLNISHYRPIGSLLLVAVSIYILVYILKIDDILFSIALKSMALLVVIFGLSIILSINPIKMIKGFIKK